MTDYTEIPCPNCQRRLRVRSEYAGKVISCTHCEHSFRLGLPMSCPHCRQTLRVPIEYLGKVITCGGCERTFLAGAEDGAAPSANATPIGPSGSAPTAQRAAPAQAAALDDRIARVRRQLATEDVRAAQLQKANREVILLQAQLADVRGQLEGTREELAQVPRLREERETARAETQQLRGELQAAQAARGELDALRQEMSGLAGGHERRLAGLTADLDALRAAHEQTEAERGAAGRVAEGLRARVAELEEAARGLGGALDEARVRSGAERQALHAEWERRHRAGEEEHARQLEEARTHFAEKRRQWEEHDTAARRQVEEARAELDRSCQEWETRHQENAAAHEQRLSTEQARAAEALRQGEQGHAEAERRLTEERAALHQSFEQLRAEAEALRGERDRHAADRDDALASWVQVEERAGAEVARLTAEIEHLGQAAEAAARREQELVGQLEAVQAERQRALTALGAQLDAAWAETAEGGGRLAALEGQLQAERAGRRHDQERFRREVARLTAELAGDREQVVTEARSLREHLDAAHAELADRGRLEVERDLLSREVEALRVRADTTATELGEQLQAARADADEARERAARAVEDQARLAAGHERAARRQHEEERARLRAEADHLRRQYDDALRRVESLTAEGEALAAAQRELGEQVEAGRAALAERGAAADEQARAEFARFRDLAREVKAREAELDDQRRQVAALTEAVGAARAEAEALREQAVREAEGRVRLQEKYDALAQERNRAAAEGSARRPTSSPEVALPTVEGARRRAAAGAREQERPLAAWQREEGRAAASAPAPRPLRERDRPAAAAGPVGEAARPRSDRFPVWVCLPLAVFLWVASLSAGSPPTAREGAFQVLFALALLLQFRLWDEFEDATGQPPPPGHDRESIPSHGPWHIVFAFAVAWNTANLAFQQAWPLLGLFLALSLAFFLWYKGLRRLCPWPIAGSLVALLKYPVLVYLLAAPASAMPEGLVPSLALVYLCFSVFELLHDDRLREAKGSAGALALAMVLMLGTSAMMAAELYQGDGSAPVVQVVLTGLAAAVFLALFWRRATGRAPGVESYLVFLIGFAWLVNFSPAGRELVLRALPGWGGRMTAVGGP